MQSWYNYMVVDRNCGRDVTFEKSDPINNSVINLQNFQSRGDQTVCILAFDKLLSGQNFDLFCRRMETVMLSRSCVTILFSSGKC